MPQQIPSMPVHSPAPILPRRQALRVTQDSLKFYWELRRLVDGFERRIMTADSVSVESGPLTLPALKGRP